MKILMIGWGAEPNISGGMDVHTSRISEGLVQSGHDVKLFAPAFNETHHSRANIEKIDAGEKPKTLAQVILSVKEYNRNIFSFAKKHDFDIIHTHDWLGAEAGFHIQQKLGKKWVHTVHSLEYMRSCRQGTGKSRIEMLEELAIRGADALITVSRFMQKEIKEKYGVESKATYNAPSVSEKDILSGIARENKRILFAGRIAEQKGLKHLIYSAKHVLKAFPGAKFVIVGKGNLRGSLEEFSKSIGIEGNVEFTGFVSREQLVEKYQKATLFVSPSVYEPFGITLLDAAVLGAPIIATKNTGALELFGKGSVAVVEEENSKELAEKIVALLGNEKMRGRMANAASEDVKKIKTWAEISEEIAAV
ncbi:MAG: glycosyltransferase family 4 protein, partial [Candidatus Aenigmarchaeota archaeon]|nr:glycosyltransferase family 4 protein [Candidatus Aenigmarchaeota archaeon]